MTYKTVWQRLGAKKLTLRITIFNVEGSSALDAYGKVVGLERLLWQQTEQERRDHVSQGFESDLHYRQDLTERVLNLTWRVDRLAELSLSAMAELVGVDWSFDYGVMSQGKSKTTEAVAMWDQLTRERIITACNTWKQCITKATLSPRAASMELNRNSTLRFALQRLFPRGVAIPAQNGLWMPPPCRACQIVHGTYCPHEEKR